jgi:hypothetical protein
MIHHSSSRTTVFFNDFFQDQLIYPENRHLILQPCVLGFKLAEALIPESPTLVRFRLTDTIGVVVIVTHRSALLNIAFRRPEPASVTSTLPAPPLSIFRSVVAEKKALQ